jgi:hypothetical protein
MGYLYIVREDNSMKPLINVKAEREGGITL